MSRKPISVVKSRLHQNCSELVKPVNDSHSLNDTTWCDWAPFDKNNYKELLGAVDNAFLVAYAIGMFISGIFGERLPLRYYLSAGMLLSGLFTSLFGLGYFWNIHMLWYFVLIQICNGLVQTTGWPSVVTCVGNWFGKGKRGLIMGIWNSHTSVGNILGSLIAGVWVNEQWGLSFVVPGAVTAAMGVITFLFLIEYPEDVDCTAPQHHTSDGLEQNQDNAEDLGNGPCTNKESSLESAARCSKEPSVQPAAISFLGALRIPGVVEFSLCLLFAKLVSYTFLYWLPLYIFNVAHFSAKQAGDLSTLFDVGGIMGGIMAGLISDYTNGRATTCCIMLILAAPMMFLYNYIGQNGITNSIVMLIICGALVNGPYALITTAVSADLGTHQSLKGNAKALSTVTAIIDGTGSIGAALGPLLAGLISPTGWNNVFYMLISADILACLVRVLGGTQMGIGAGERPVVQAGPLEVQSIGHEGLWDNENSCPTLRTTFFPWVNSRQMKLCDANVALPSLCASNSPQLLCRLVYKEIIAWKSSLSRDRGYKEI
uniref:Glucose-6-phosphate exchanger SLC37A2 n=1 Tax=Ursus maritimus TaxID=29073 RepID=A0A452T1M8_URSMA